MNLASPSLLRRLLFRRAVLLLIFPLAVVAPLWHIHVIDRDMPSTHADLLLVWTGVRATLNGNNPYTDKVTREIQIGYYGAPVTSADHVKKMAYAYPPYTALVLAPIAKLSWPVLRLAFLFSVPLLMLATVPLWMHALNLSWNWKSTMLFSAAFAASWPVMWAMRLQQPTLLLCFLLAAGCYLLRKNKDVVAALLLALTAIKPQMVGPLLIWLMVWALYQRRIRFIISSAAFASALIVWSSLAVPGWPVSWHAALLNYAKYTKVQPLLQTIFGHWLGLLLMVFVAVCTAWIGWEHRKSSVASPEFGAAIAIVLAATVLLAPTERPMIYNDVFLVPGFLILMRAKPTEDYVGLARLIALGALGWTFIAPVLASIGEIVTHPSDQWDSVPFQLALLPISLPVALGFIVLQARKLSRQLQSEAVTAALL